MSEKIFQPGTFALFPKSLVGVSGHLTKNEMRILLAVLMHTNDFGACWPSIATLGRESGLPAKKASSAFSGLTKKGFVFKSGRVIHVDPGQWPTPEKGEDHPQIGGISNTPETGGDDPQIRGGTPPNRGDEIPPNRGDITDHEQTNEQTKEETTDLNPPQVELFAAPPPPPDPAETWVQRFREHWPKKAVPGTAAMARLKKEIAKRGLDECLRLLNDHARFLRNPPKWWKGNGATAQTVPKVFSEKIMSIVEDHMAEPEQSVPLFDPHAQDRRLAKEARRDALEVEVTSWCVHAKASAVDTNNVPPPDHWSAPHRPYGVSEHMGIQFCRFGDGAADFRSFTAAAYAFQMKKLGSGHELWAHAKSQHDKFRRDLVPTKADVFRHEQRLAYRATQELLNAPATT